ncbi:MAG: M16 family metallopeptidase [Saprospiraceae bacterium]
MRIITILFFLTGLLPVQAQQTPAEIIPLNPRVSSGKLDNGLTYYILPNAKPEQKVELRLVVNAGSILESDKQQGLAHFCEHMAFNGTRNFPKNELVSFLQGMGVRFGADLNAYTSFDETVYFLPIPTDRPGNLEKGFQVLEDWAHQVLYEAEEIDKERGVVLEEARLGKGAEDRMFRQYQTQLFAGSRYGERLPIGKEAIIQTASYKTVRRFYKDWYRPNLMAVVVVGDVDGDKALALVKKHFGAIKNPAGAPKRTYAPIPSRAASDALVVTDPEATAYDLSVYFDASQVPAAKTLEDYQKVLLRGLFNEMLNARLNDLRQSATPPFLFASAGYGTYVRGYGAFNASAGIGKDGVETAVNALIGAALQARLYGFTRPELQRALQRRASSIDRALKERDKTESGVYASEFTRHFLSGEPAPGIEKESEYFNAFMPKVTLEDVNAVAAAFDLEANAFVVLTAPEKGDIPLPDNAGLLRLFQKAVQQKVQPYEEKILAEGLMAPLENGGAIVAEARDENLGVTLLKLSNGVSVTLKTTDFKNDEILLSGTRKGGTNNYSPEDKYNSLNTIQILREMGLSEFTPVDLRKVNAGKIANVNPVIGQLTSGFRGSSSVRDFETMLQLVYLNATAPRRDDALFTAFKNKQNAMWAMMGANPQFAFVDTLYKFMFGSHPYAPLLPKPEVYEKVNLDRVMEICRERLGDAAGMHFTIVGSLDEATMKPLIAKYLGALPSSGNETPWKDNGLRMVGGQRELSFYKGTEPKSLIQMIWFGETPFSEDTRLHIRGLTEILNIRVIEKLREELGGIYGGGFSGAMSRYPYENFQLALNLPCGPENVEKLVAAVQNEIETLMREGPSTENLDKVKQQWREGYREDLRKNAFWLSNLEEIMFFGDDPQLLLKYNERIDALTTGDLREAARLVFASPNRMKAVLYPEK